ncbi:MAG TPA: hypothetical protein VK615_06795 [Candidatus Binatia bacterium]|nr:hypothetical protein [Candidatus Binatia bacterium]
MKTPEQERLLGDVLYDESYAGYRTQVRERMLGEVRRHRQLRRTKQLLALAACLAVAAGAHWIFTFRHPTNPQLDRVAVVHSVPLKPEQIVTTARHASGLAVVGSRDMEVSSLRLGIVETVARLPADTLTDEQLLDLFKGRAVALVNLANGKTLLFLDEQSSDFATP